MSVKRSSEDEATPGSGLSSSALRRSPRWAWLGGLTVAVLLMGWLFAGLISDVLAPSSSSEAPGEGEGPEVTSRARPPPRSLESVPEPSRAEPRADSAAPRRGGPSRSVVPVEGTPMDRLRALVDVDPAAALALAREDERRAPDSPEGDERSFCAMQALVHLGRIAAARDEATDFFARHPESPWGARVERLTGAHPRGPQNPW